MRSTLTSDDNARSTNVSSFALPSVKCSRAEPASAEVSVLALHFWPLFPPAGLSRAGWAWSRAGRGVKAQRARPHHPRQHREGHAARERPDGVGGGELAEQRLGGTGG